MLPHTAPAVDVYGNAPAKYAGDNGHTDMVRLLQSAGEEGVLAAALAAGKAAAAKAREATADADEAAEAAELVMRAAAAASGAAAEAGAAPADKSTSSAGVAAAADVEPAAGAAAASGLRHRGAAANAPAASATEQFVTEPPLPGILGGSSRVPEAAAATTTATAAAPAKRPGFKLMTVHIVLLALLIGVAVPLGAFIALRRAAPDGR